MATNCSNVSKKEAETIAKTLKVRNFNLGNLSYADVYTALTRLATDYNITPEVLIKDKNYTHMIAQAIAAARNEKMREGEILKKEYNGKVGNATFIISSDVKRNEPRNNRDTIYVFTDNLQAHNALNDNVEIVAGLVEPENIIVNVNKSSAISRTDSQGTKNENAVGLVVKMNAQGEDGKFLTKEGEFEDTNESFEAFKRINAAAIDKIAKAVGLEENDNPAVKLVFPSRVALPEIDEKTGKVKSQARAGLPKRFAEFLSRMLYERLGINSQVIEHPSDSNYRGLYGLEIQGLPKKKSTTAASEREKRQNEGKKEAIESLKAVRPKLEFRPAADIRNLLVKVFPNIAERKARVDYIATMFSELLTMHIDSAVNDLRQAHEAGTLNDAQESLYDLLTVGNENDQRRAALSYITYGDKSLVDVIFDEIYSTMNNFVKIYNEGGDNLQWVLDHVFVGAPIYDENGVEQSLPSTLMPIWYEFQNEAATFDWDGQTKAQRAKFRMKHLSDAFNILVSDPNIFNAVLRASFEVLEDTENIHIDPSTSLVTQTAEDTENVDEEGTSDDRSGLNLIRYKMLNPVKTLSARMKKLLSNQYKMSYSVKHGYSYVFDDLGQRVKMDSNVVYYKLLDKFSAMNEPEDFYRILNEVEQDYPWFSPVKEALLANRDLLNEFYRAMKVHIPYVVLTPNGNLQYKARSLRVEALLDLVTKNYEGRVVLGSHSLYTETGEYSAKNVIRQRNFLEIKSKTPKEEIKERHPLGWAHRVLNKNSKLYTIENIAEALSILRGEKEDVSTSLEDALNNVGIDTTDMNLEALIPYIDEETIASLETLEQLEEIFTPEQMRRVRSVLEGLMAITNERTGFKDGKNLIDDLKGAYMKIANALSVASDGYSQSSFLDADGNSRYAYGAPDLIHKLTGIISNVSDSRAIERGSKYIDTEFGPYDFYKNPVTGELCGWAKLLRGEVGNEDHPITLAIRSNFKYVNVLEIPNYHGVPGSEYGNGSIGKIDNLNFVTGLIASFFLAGSGARGQVDFGYYRSPLLSDTDALVLFKGVAYKGEDYEDRVLDGLVEVMEQELSRISASYNPSGPDIEFYKNNAGKFNFFTSLRGLEGEIIQYLADIASSNDPITASKERKVYLRSLVKDIVDSQFEKFLNDFTEKQKETLYSLIDKSLYEASKESDESESKEKTPSTLAESLKAEKENESKESLTKEAQRAQVDRWLKQFYFNDYYAQSQIIQLTFGDLAYAKNIRDFIKRYKQSYSAGERLMARDENGNPMYENCMYLEDKVAVSNSWGYIKELLESAPNLTSMDKEIIKAHLNSFGGIKETDGQSFRTPNSFKKIFKAMGGKWTPSMEEGLERMKRGQLEVKDFMMFWNSIKPFLVSHEAVNVNGRNERVITQHKNSEYMLTALYSVLNTALNHSPELVGLQKFMEANDIDVCHFHSSVKVGYHSPFDLSHDSNAFRSAYEKNNGVFNAGNYTFKADSYKEYTDKLWKALNKSEVTQEEYNEAINRFAYKNAESVEKSLQSQFTKSEMIHTFPLDDYMVMQPSDDHLEDAEAIAGSQLKNIIPADLPDTFTFTFDLGGTPITLNKTDAIRLYNSLIVDNHADAFDTKKKEMSNPKNLASMLKASMEGNPRYGDDVKEALELGKDGKFVEPFNAPNLANKIETLLFSAFKNAIQRQKITGGNTILVSNFGLSDKLSIEWNDPNDHSKGVKYIPAYLPAYKRDMINDYLIEHTERVGDHETTYWTVDYEKLKENNAEDILKIIGYRIPTEDKYSILPIKIIGFMPIEAGTTIMLPSDIITMSGTDFDIDKLFIMIKATKRVVASPKLIKAFNNWLRENKEPVDAANMLLNAIAGEEVFKDEDIAKIQRKLYANRDGITQEVIDSVRERSELFDTFMSEVGGKYKYDYPKYVPYTAYMNKDDFNVDTFSKLDGIEDKRVKKFIRDNMMIDFIWGVLTSPEGSRAMLTPATYENLKQNSRQCRCLSPSLISIFYEKYKDRIKKEENEEENEKGWYNTLNSISTDEFDEFIKKYADPDDPLDVGFYMESHRNLMDGRDLIGMSAVNSSNHYKFQFTHSGEEGVVPLTLDKEYQFWIKVPGFKKQHIEKLDLVYSPITGQLVGRINAEYQAAAPDNGKDPVLGDVGANTITFKRIGLMARLGFPIQVIGIFNTSDDLAKYGKDIRKDEDKAKANDWVVDVEEVLKAVADLRMTGALGDNGRETAKKFSYFMDKIDKLAKTLQLANCYARSDSPNGALPISAAEVTQKRLSTDKSMAELRSAACPIHGLDQIVDTELDVTKTPNVRDAIMKKPIPRLQSAYTYGIKSAISLCGNAAVDDFLQVSDVVYSGVKRLANYSKKDLIYSSDVKTLKQFINELTGFLLSKDSVFGSDENGSIMDKRNYFIHDFPMKFKQFLDTKDENGYKYQDLRDLTLIKMLSNADKKGIKYLNVGGKTSENSRKYLKEALDSMLFDSRPEVVDFALDLLRYAYYNDALTFGHSNYGIFFTTTFLTSIPRLIDSLRANNGELRSSEDMMKNYVDQFMLNHSKLIPYIESDKVVKRGDDIIVSKNLHEILYEEGIKKFPVKFLRMDNDVYVLVSEGSRDATYTKTGYNSHYKSDGTIFYDAALSATEIKWDSLKDRGRVFKIEEEGTKKGKENKAVPSEGKSLEPQLNAPADIDASTLAKYQGPTFTTVSVDDINPSYGFANEMEKQENVQFQDAFADALKAFTKIDELAMKASKEDEVSKFEALPDSKEDKVCVPPIKK